MNGWVWPSSFAFKQGSDGGLKPNSAQEDYGYSEYAQGIIAFVQLYAVFVASMLRPALLFSIVTILTKNNVIYFKS